MKEVSIREIQLQLPAPRKLLTPAVTTILILMVIGYALANYARDFTAYNLLLSRGAIWEFKVWQLVTHAFIGGGYGLIYNAFIVLFVGSAVEKELRTRGMIKLCLFVIVVCGLVWLLVNVLIGADFPGGGTHSLGFGLFGAFGVLYYRQRFLFWMWTVEAQTIAWVYIAVGIVIGIASPMLWIWVGGALAGYLYIKGKGMFLARRGYKTEDLELRQKSFVDLD